MASSDEEIDSIYGGEFTTPEDEIRYLKSIVTELESRNKDQTITLENITEEVSLFTEEKHQEVAEWKKACKESELQISILEEEIRGLKNKLNNQGLENKSQETSDDMRQRLARELETISITAKSAGKLLQLIGKSPVFDIHDLHQRRIGQSSMEKWAEEQKRLWDLVNGLYHDKMEQLEDLVIKDREIETLKSKVKELEESSSLENETLKKSLEYRIKQLEDDLMFMEDENEDVKAELAAYQEEAPKIRDMEKKFSELEAENENMRTLLNENGKKQEEEFSVQKKENQRLEEEVETLTAELEKREKQITALEKEVVDLKYSLDESDKEFDQLEANHSEEVAQLKFQIELKDKELQETKKQHSSAKKELEEADKDLDALEAEVKTLKEQNTTLEKKLHQLSVELEELQSRDAVASKNLLKSASSQTDFHLNFTQSIGTQIDKRLLQDEENSKKVVAELKDHISHLQDQKVQLQADFNTLQDDIFKISTDKSKLRDERDRLKDENERVKSDLEKALDALEKLRTELARWKQSDKDLHNKLAGLAQKEAEIAHLEEEVTLLNSEVENERMFKSELAEKSGEIEELQTKLRLLSREKDENKALHQEISTLKKENEHLRNKTLSMTFEVEDQKMKTVLFHTKDQMNELILKLYYVFKEHLDNIKEKRVDIMALKSEIWLDMNFKDKGRLFYLFRYNK